MQMNNLICELDEGVATVIVNRPKALNALNRETLEELLACFTELATSRELVGVIITGAGDKAFVAGADIAAMQGLDALAGREFGVLEQRVMRVIETFAKPVIAAVNGFALGGGCELAMACDIRIASGNARFGQPEVNLGVVPGFGGTQRLPRLIGSGPALELLLTGEMIGAEEAYRLGLVNRVVTPEQLLPRCREILAKVAQKGPISIRLCKEAVRAGLELDIDSACRQEADLFGLCFASADQKEGMKAFLEKRAAKFTDH
ncbi:MAG: enoyl-CoA hydratase/isomerase family protein [Desulfofustis sp.]|nr:enoyl-CoA hydratase/isomerase family protein [Desulfofustis sp.]